MILVLCGKSGCGKDTTASAIKGLGFEYIISHTSRPMRENEKEGDPYYFVNNEEIQNLINSGDLFEYRDYKTAFNNEPQTWYYGTCKKSIKDDRNYVAVVDIDGLKSFKKEFGDRVLGIYLDVSDEVRTDRARGRGSFCQTEWDRRLKADAEDFSEDALKIIDHRIDSLVLEDVVQKIKEIVC